LTVFVDSNVLLDVVTNDPVWAEWSLAQLERLSLGNDLAISEIVYAEISAGYNRVEEVNDLVEGMRLTFVATHRPALFLAAKVHQRYRKAGGKKACILPDFFISALAALSEVPLVTRDAKRFRTYFPQLELISP
jgi:predicted nucleic acid-binding protein